MAINNFAAFAHQFTKLNDGRYIRGIANRIVAPPAKKFNKHIINFLTEKDYPLNQGNGPQSDSERIDPIYDMTPTQRLWGTFTLAGSQMTPVITARRGDINVVFRNAAPHAGYFFEKTKRHEIEPKDKPLVYWYDTQYLPWDRAHRGGPKKRMVPVDHPGTMAYKVFIERIFEESHEKSFSDAVLNMLRTMVHGLRK